MSLVIGQLCHLHVAGPPRAICRHHNLIDVLRRGGQDFLDVAVDTKVRRPQHQSAEWTDPALVEGTHLAITCHVSREAEALQMLAFQSSHGLLNPFHGDRTRQFQRIRCEADYVLCGIATSRSTSCCLTGEQFTNSLLGNRNCATLNLCSKSVRALWSCKKHCQSQASAIVIHHLDFDVISAGLECCCNTVWHISTLVTFLRRMDSEGLASIHEEVDLCWPNLASLACIDPHHPNFDAFPVSPPLTKVWAVQSEVEARLSHQHVLQHATSLDNRVERIHFLETTNRTAEARVIACVPCMTQIAVSLADATSQLLLPGSCPSSASRSYGKVDAGGLFAEDVQRPHAAIAGATATGAAS
mmetsp:Transcript_19664/g.34860  ORF Transcript_19664/g.34860 Transcript_19664/m.34860 type:complete len:357 (+) Transcript_19664:614-1684(+)